MRAVNPENEELNSEMSDVVFYCMAPGTTTVKTKNNNGSITVSWKKVYGADKYYVYYYSQRQGKYIRVGQTDKLKFTHTKGPKNEFLNYKVKAVYTQDIYRDAFFDIVLNHYISLHPEVIDNILEQ